MMLTKALRGLVALTLFILAVSTVSALAFVPDARLFPANAGTTTEIRCDIDFPTTDVAYNIQTIEYAFYRDGGVVKDFAPDDRLLCDLAMCPKDSTMTCRARITENDDAQHESGISNGVGIRNTPPTLDSVSISPEFPAVGQVINCEYSGANDPDGDTTGVFYAWESRADNGPDEPWVDAGIIESYVDNTGAAGTQWRCLASVTDLDESTTYIATTYIHDPADLPSSYIGTTNEEAEIRKYINYGSYETSLERFGAYRADELTFGVLARAGNYMLIFEDTCEGGTCGGTNEALYDDAGMVNAPPAGDDYGSYIVNPQDNVGAYPTLAGAPPVLLGWDFWEYEDVVNCLDSRSSTYNNEFCRIPFVIEQNMELGNTDLSLETYTDIPNLVQSQTFQTGITLTSIGGTGCDEYTQFELLPNDLVTTVGDEIIYWGFAWNDVDGEWVDVTHEIDVISSHNNVATVDDVMDWSVTANAPTAGINIAGKVAITGNFCGLQDVVTLEIQDVHADCLYDDLTVDADLIQESAGTVGTWVLTAHNVDTGVDEEPALGNTIYTIFDENVILNPQQHDWEIQNCIPGTDICATHVLVGLEHTRGGSSCHTQPTKRTVAVRVPAGGCQHYRQCALYEELDGVSGAVRWLANELPRMYPIGDHDGFDLGLLGEFLSEPFLDHLSLKTQVEVQDMATAYTGDEVTTPLSLYDVFCPGGQQGVDHDDQYVIPKFCEQLPNAQEIYDAFVVYPDEYPDFIEDAYDLLDEWPVDDEPNFLNVLRYCHDEAQDFGEFREICHIEKTKFCTDDDCVMVPFAHIIEQHFLIELMLEVMTSPTYQITIEEGLDGVGFRGDGDDQGFGDSDTPDYTLYYSTCPSLETDVFFDPITCDFCVYNGAQYLDGEKADIDGDEFEEVCTTSSPGVWIEDDTIYGDCDVINGYQECSEAGSSYIPDTALIYTAAAEDLGVWCVYDSNADAFNWLTGDLGGINLEDIQDLDNVDEYCGFEQGSQAFDSNCNMYNSFKWLADGVYDFNTYTEGADEYLVWDYQVEDTNVDRFDPVCRGTIDVHVDEYDPDTDTYTDLENAIVTISFRHDSDPGPDENLIDTEYATGLTNANGDVSFSGMPATKLVINAAFPSCASDEIVYDLDYNEDYSVSLSLVCGTLCGNGFVDDGEECDTIANCPPGTSGAGASCNSMCENVGCSPIYQQGDVTCPEGTTLLTQSTVVILDGEPTTMVIASCNPIDTLPDGS